MQLVARPAGGAFRNELGLQLTRRWIEDDRVKIDDAIEDLRGSDEAIELLALLALLGKPVRRAGAAQGAGDCRTDNADSGLLQAGDAFGHFFDDRLGRRIAVLAEIADAFKPDRLVNARSVRARPASGRCR